MSTTTAPENGQTSTHPDPDDVGAAELDAALGRLIDIVGRLSDGDLHRAHFDGGWTVAQVISHLNVCTLVWLGDLARLRHDPELSFFFREEIGHDLTGYPPPTVESAVGQLTSTRRTLSRSYPAAYEGLEDRTVEIPDLGTMKIIEWMPLINGHLTMHTGQAEAVLTNRNAMPEGF